MHFMRLSLPLLFLSSSLFASVPGFDLQMQLSLNGKNVASPRVKVASGEKASITQQVGKNTSETFIEVVATERIYENHRGILMKFKVGRMENGRVFILSKPQIITKENHETELIISKDQITKDFVKLKIKAKKIQIQ